MRPRSSRRPALTIGAAILLLPLSARLSLGQPPQQHCSIRVFLSVNQQALSGRPAMVSAIRDGRIVQQSEANLTTGMEFNTDSIKPGVYDIRVEGDGLVTEVKRGIHAFGGQTTEITFQVKSGQGVHIVEYAVGGLPREEVAARLARLESQVAELSKPRPQR
jgi:hypothetical protein